MIAGKAWHLIASSWPGALGVKSKTKSDLEKQIDQEKFMLAQAAKDSRQKEAEERERAKRDVWESWWNLDFSSILDNKWWCVLFFSKKKTNAGWSKSQRERFSSNQRATGIQPNVEKRTIKKLAKANVNMFLTFRGAFRSPTDQIMSPATQKIEAKRKHLINK